MKTLLKILLLLTMILSASVCQQRRELKSFLPSWRNREVDIPVSFMVLANTQTPVKRHERANTGHYSLNLPGNDRQISNTASSNTNSDQSTPRQPVSMDSVPPKMMGSPTTNIAHAISFADNTPRQKSFRTMEAPDCSNGSNALPCEFDPEYNADIRNRISELLLGTQMNGIIQDPTVRQLLNDTGVVRDKTLNPGDGLTIRSGFFPSADFVTETPACRALESIIYPQRAKTTENDWAFVLNQDSVKQGVRVEKCLSEGSQCSLGGIDSPTMRTTCRQKFIYRKLLVLSNTGVDIQPESVLIPSCCVCYIRTIRGHIKKNQKSMLSPRRVN